MKNRITKIIVSALCLLTVVACSDQFLQDKRDYSKMIPEDIYKDPAQANAVFARIYAMLFERHAHQMCGADVLLRQDQSGNHGENWNLTEEMKNSSGNGNTFTAANTKQTKAGNFQTNSPYLNDPQDNVSYNVYTRWTVFANMYMINNFIEEIDREGRRLYNDPTFWDQLKGQAVFCRAWLYFDVLRTLGGIPYYNRDNDMAPADEKLPRMQVQDFIDEICKDFELAAELLPEKWSAENEGRFTSVAAMAMISRVRLYMASPIFNASWETGGSRWQAALEAGLAAESAANAAGYGTNISDIETWCKAFYSYPTTSFNPEAIIKIPKNQNAMVILENKKHYNQWEDLVRPGSVRAEGNTSAGIAAPDEMVALFPMADGRRALAANGYDDVRFYRNRDPRFYRTFAFSGCQWPGRNNQIWLYAWKHSRGASQQQDEHRYTEGARNDGGTNEKSRAIVWKMTNPNVAVGNEGLVGTDIIEYRYAEILLNIAECYAALGDVGNCAAYLKKIRDRVGAGPVPTPADKFAAIEAVLYERRVELAYEGKRFWDMRRWLLYEGGAGFDPRMTNVSAENLYDPELAWGAGWKLYNGKDGKPAYTKENNVLTRLRLPRFSGTVLTGKIWAYDLNNVYQIASTDEITHPLQNHADLLAVPPIRRDMTYTERNSAFDKLDEFYAKTGMITVNPRTDPEMHIKYAINSGGTETAQNYLFSWRGWYYVYPLHYDHYTPGKGNDWIEQTEGWIRENISGTPIDANIDQQDGTYVYCTPE